MLAAEFWAEARRIGRPTAADTRLDADAILAGQAASLTQQGFSVVVATMNPAHLSRYVDARHWRDVKISDD